MRAPSSSKIGTIERSRVCNGGPLGCARVIGTSVSRDPEHRWTALEPHHPGQVKRLPAGVERASTQVVAGRLRQVVEVALPAEHSGAHVVVEVARERANLEPGVDDRALNLGLHAGSSGAE